MEARTVKESFWLRVNKRGPFILKTRCWEWIGSKQSKGYGQFWNKVTTVRAHRWSYEFHIAPIRNNLLICHKCDNPGCVNPEHLFAGTQQDNIKDCSLKKRLAPVAGEVNGRSKLTNKQVLDIRSRPVYRGINIDLAKEFNVSPPSICNIRKKKIWKHL